MSAKEMFEEIGFKYIRETRTFIEYTNSNTYSGKERIKFDYTLKRFVYDARTGQGNLAVRQINMPIFKAIQQQIKELGWADGGNTSE
jgi:hypothetical protein